VLRSGLLAGESSGGRGLSGAVEAGLRQRFALACCGLRAKPYERQDSGALQPRQKRPVTVSLMLRLHHLPISLSPCRPLD